MKEPNPKTWPVLLGLAAAVAALAMGLGAQAYVDSHRTIGAVISQT